MIIGFQDITQPPTHVYHGFLLFVQLSEATLQIIEQWLVSTLGGIHHVLHEKLRLVLVDYCRVTLFVTKESFQYKERFNALLDDS